MTSGRDSAGVSSASWTAAERSLPYVAATAPNKQIRRGTRKSVQALEKDIRTWIAPWTTGPKPSFRTETADEILDRLASCYAGFLTRKTSRSAMGRNCRRVAGPGARRLGERGRHGRLAPRGRRTPRRLRRI